MIALLFIAWRTRSRAVSFLRLLAFLTFASTLASLACARRANAEMTTSAMRVGRDLLPLVRELDGAATVSLNGERITLEYDGTTRSVREVLDAAEESCRLGGVGGGDGQLGIHRRGDDDEGVVMCFAKGARSAASLAEQVAAFADTSDLGAFGKLRYVYARKEANGGAAALVATTEDSFRLDSLAARDAAHDAPGSDDPSLPRPSASVRFLSAQIEGASYGTRGYRTRRTPDAVRAEYDAAMLARGFTVVEIPARKTSAYSKDGVLVTLATAIDTNGDTLVSIGTMGADDRRSK
jgi:hypothetical protein